MLGDKQVAGAGDRQEFGDALDDAEQQGVDQVGHGRSTGKGAHIVAEGTARAAFMNSGAH
ncbi:MAG: hypothetical protein ABI588_08575 [Arenimonas sp.]